MSVVTDPTASYYSTPQGQVDLATSTVQVTPASSFQNGALTKQGVNDYFRFAERDIAKFDTNKDGVLSKEETIKAFGNGNEKTGEKYYEAINQDGKDGLSVVDMAAFTMAQDGPKQLFANTTVSPTLFSSAQNGYQQFYNKYRPGETLPPMAFDGQITAAESHSMDKIIENQTDVAGVGMKGLQDKLNLEAAYERYQTPQAKL